MRSSLLSLFLSVITFFGANAATISSTGTGGLWSSAGTWVGNTVPGASDDVIINGVVYGNGSCRNLTVSSSGSLLNESGYGQKIQVNGNVTNNGVI